jgi:ferrous iron transport protein A
MELLLSENSEYKTLAEMRVGERARVVRLLVEGPTRRRLLDLGLLPDTEVRAALKSPMGDPMAYNIRGSVLALRSEDASKIVVNPLSSKCDKETS